MKKTLTRILAISFLINRKIVSANFLGTVAISMGLLCVYHTIYHGSPLIVSLVFFISGGIMFNLKKK